MSKIHYIASLLILIGSSFASAEEGNSAWICTVKGRQTSYLNVVFTKTPDQGAFSGAATLMGISPNARLINTGTVVGEMIEEDALAGHMSFDVHTTGQMGHLILHLLKDPQLETMSGYGLGEGLKLIFLNCEHLNQGE